MVNRLTATLSLCTLSAVFLFGCAGTRLHADHHVALAAVGSGLSKHPFTATGRPSGRMDIVWEVDHRREEGRWIPLDDRTVRFTSDDGSVVHLLRYENDEVSNGLQVRFIAESDLGRDSARGQSSAQQR